LYSSGGVITSLGAASDGELPIGSTGNPPVLATLTGTANQITVTNAAGSITLSTPQDIHTGALPTFSGLLPASPSAQDLGGWTGGGANAGEAIGLTLAFTYAGGAVDYRWRHLYLSGNLSDGTNTVTVANCKTAFDHSSSDGTDHTYIDQDVTTTASPTFANLSLGTGELTAGSINRASGTLTLEIGGTAVLSLASSLVTLAQDLRTDRWLASNTNIFLGEDVAGTGNLAHAAGVEGWYNTFIGYRVGEDISTGAINTGVGATALAQLTTGNDNTALGDNALLAITTGSKNTACGHDAGVTLATVDGCVFLGHEAGYYETNANKLFIDNAKRTNEADGRVKALVYGVFDSATANQSLVVNGYLRAREAIELLERSSDPTQPSEGE
jgi:hypothetical protein